MLGASRSRPFSIVCVLAALAAVTSLGCGSAEGSDAAGDAASRDPDADATGALLIPWLEEGAPPIEPPDFAGCRDGWRTVDDSGATPTCDPFPEGGAQTCPAGQAHFPGEPGCTPVGSPCPAGDFSETLPADRNVLYVLPGATGTGDSPSSPRGDLGIAFGGLPIGTVVALSRGTHMGTVRLARDITLWGACAGESLLRTDLPSMTESVVLALGGAGGLRDLTVGESPRGGVWAGGTGAEITLGGVVVRDAATLAVYGTGNGAHITGRSVVVRGTQPDPSSGAFGRAVAAQDGAAVELSRVLLEQNREIAVFAGRPGTTLVLAAAVVRDTEGQANDGARGLGVSIQDGAGASLAGVMIERSRTNGVLVSSAGTDAVLSDVIVRDTRVGERDGSGGRGVSVQSGATSTVSRTLVERCREVGVFTSNTGTVAAFTDVIVRDTMESNDMTSAGLSVQRGATTSLLRGEVERTPEVGILALDGGASATLTDVVVRDTETASDGRFGRALSLQGEATLTVSRGLFERSRDLGVGASGEGAVLALADVAVWDVEGLPNGRIGRGLSVQAGAEVELDGVLVAGTRELGVYASDPGTSLTMVDTIVLDSRARSCAEDACADNPSGHGVGIYERGVSSMTRFIIARSDLCGVHVARNSEVDLSDGEVRECTIGVCLQVVGYDITRLSAGVRFVDNDTNLETTVLPIPESTDALPPVP